VLPDECDVQYVNFYTARVFSTPHDPHKQARQDLYLRALKAHCDRVRIIIGMFQETILTMPLADKPGEFARVRKTEEKMTDVNMAVDVVSDAYRDRYDCAALVTLDRDLSSPMRLVSAIGKRVALLKPRRAAAAKLSKIAHFDRHITEVHLYKAQMPDVVIASDGTEFRRPDDWKP
jgi:hypothetical protein